MSTNLSLEERQEYARRHAAILTEMVERPIIKEVSARKWRSRIWIDGEMCAVLFTQIITPPPGSDPNTTGKYTVQLTYGSHRTPYAVAFMSLVRDYSLDDVVAFLRLDTVDPATVEWKDITNYREIITIEKALASVLNER